MAGITSASSSSCFPLVTRTTTTKTTHYALCLSSLDSKLFGLRFHNPNLSKPDSLPCSSPSPVTTARFGGPRSYDSRRPRKSDSDDDQALNISSIRWLLLLMAIFVWFWNEINCNLQFFFNFFFCRSATVRLIDQQQNMVSLKKWNVVFCLVAEKIE
jgi:hypothetical protein